MPTLVVPQRVHAQVDDFPAGCPRSVKGALHLKPGTKVITDGELEHLKAQHAKLVAACQVLPDAAPPTPSAPAKQKARPEPDVTKPDMDLSANIAAADMAEERKKKQKG